MSDKNKDSKGGTEMNKVVNDQESAEMLGVAPQTLRNWRSLRKGPPYLKVGRAVRYRQEDLIAYLDKRRIDPEKV
jgi:predicted DNA-binding transcriptional regulator AlpA